MATARTPRRDDPFAPLAPVLAALGRAPLPPVLLVTGDDDWIVHEAVRRATAAFRAAFPEGETSEYDATGNGVKEAVADAATVALFATNRLVVLDGTDLFRSKKLTADEVDGLLDDAKEAGLGAPPGANADARALERLARKARALVLAAGASLDGDLADAARKVTGRVKRADRTPELAALLGLAGADEGEAAETSASRLTDYASRATVGDNGLLVHAVSPDAAHHALQALVRSGTAALFDAPDDGARRERLIALGLEHAVERNVAVDAEVFDILTERGRLAARPFLLELDKLIGGAPGGRVTAEAAARLVADERKEYGSDFVDAVAQRRFVPALRILDRLMAADDFAAFRPFGKDEAGAPGGKKGPKGEAAFFPLLGLLGGEIRRMLALKAALAEGASAAADLRGRRADYRTFVDRVLPALKAARPGAAPVPIEGHPFVLHRSFAAAQEWTLGELVDAMKEIAGIDEGVKSGVGSGPELLEAFLLSRATPPERHGRSRSI